MEKTKVALLGAGFIGEIHLESYRRFVPEAEVTAVFSGTERRAEEFARRHAIPHWFASVDELLARADCEIVDIGPALNRWPEQALEPAFCANGGIG